MENCHVCIRAGVNPCIGCAGGKSLRTCLSHALLMDCLAVLGEEGQPGWGSGEVSRKKDVCLFLASNIALGHFDYESSVTCDSSRFGIKLCTDCRVNQEI